MAEPLAATVVCDLEGRIRAFDAPAQELFGYSSEEVVGHKRLQSLAAGLVAVGPLAGWLAEARTKGRLQALTVLRGRDGVSFSADLTLAPLKDGFEAVARPRPEIPVAQALPTSAGVRAKAWLGITRAPFLTATVAPVVLAGAWAWATGRARPFPAPLFALTVGAAALLHVAANVLNDYFDFKSGADGLNNDHFAPFSGGSRSIELGLLSPRGALISGLAALAASTSLGVLIALWRGWELMLFGLAGAFAAWFYTAPPLRLVARKGLGELVVGLCFGPLIVAGSVFALTGRADASAYLVGLPLGLFTTAILWINELPDAPSDKLAGKTNLVVVLGPRRAALGYCALISLAFASIAVDVALRALSPWCLLALLATPLAIHAARVALAHHSDRTLVRANAATIQLHLAVGVLLSVGALIGST